MTNAAADSQYSEGSCLEMTVLTGRHIVRLSASQFTAAQRTLERAFFDYPLMVYACPDAAARTRGVSARCTRRSFATRCGTAKSTLVPAWRAWPAGCRPAFRFPRFFREVRAGLLRLPVDVRLAAVSPPDRIRPVAHEAPS